MAGVDAAALEEIIAAVKAEETLDKEIASLKEQLKQKQEQKKNGNQLLKDNKAVVELLKKSGSKKATGTRTRNPSFTDKEIADAVGIVIKELKAEKIEEIKSSKFYERCNSTLGRNKSQDSVYYKKAVEGSKIKTSGQKAGLKFHIG